MIQALYDLFGIVSIDSYSDLAMFMAAILIILFTVTSFIQLFASFFHR